MYEQSSLPHCLDIILRWMYVMGQLFGGTFSAALAAYLVYGQRFDASRTGFSLTMASAYWLRVFLSSLLKGISVGFCSQIMWWVRAFNEFEVQGKRLCLLQ